MYKYAYEWFCRSYKCGKSSIEPTFEKFLSDADTIITLTSGVSFVVKVSFIVLYK